MDYEGALGLYGSGNFYQYAAGNPINFVDVSGFETEVIFWDPVGYGSSSFGHVSVRIDSTAYSFGPGGMTIQDAAAYVARNNFRDGHGYILGLSPAEEAALKARLNGKFAAYNALDNNCTAPVQDGLWGGHDDDEAATLPNDLEARVFGLAIGETYYTATDPALHHGWGLGAGALNCIAHTPAPTGGLTP